MQEKIKINNALQFAEILAEKDISEIETTIENYPMVAVFDEMETGWALTAMVDLNDFEEPDFIPNIQRIMLWHTEFVNKGMDSTELQTLLAGRTNLAQYSEHLGRYVARLETENKTADFKRKRVRDSYVIIKRKAGETIGMAQAEARIETEKYDTHYVETLGTWKESKALYDAVRETLNAMASNLRALEQEQKMANFSNRA